MPDLDLGLVVASLPTDNEALQAIVTTVLQRFHDETEQGEGVRFLSDEHRLRTLATLVLLSLRDDDRED